MSCLQIGVEAKSWYLVGFVGDKQLPASSWSPEDNRVKQTCYPWAEILTPGLTSSLEAIKASANRNKVQSHCLTRAPTLPPEGSYRNDELGLNKAASAGCSDVPSLHPG